jgi:predicted lactoylglutathione lyase
MTSVSSIILEVPDPSATEAFHSKAFGLDDRIGVRASEVPSSGFRGYSLSLIVSQPSTVDSLIGTAIEAGATVLKPVKKSFWGYAGVVQSPDGTIWKVATSEKKDSGSATREVDDVVLLLGVEDVKASKEFYVDHGLSVKKSFGSKYVEFDAADSDVKLALYTRRAAAKDAGVDPEGSGSHRIAIGSDTEPFTDPDGFAWEATGS